ncbi:MAG: gamma-glutamyltransferase, partial [Sulfobacillus sp.]|nr:gamma-glutamyltransferase [Sulfobacillus sp.]
VLLESRFSPEVAEELQRRGHDIQVIGPWDSGGTVQVIQVMDGVFQGASDPRGIGQTQGY